MLHFFTDPYEDELFYNIIARYHYYSGNKNYKDTFQELFRDRNVIPSIYFPCHIGALTNVLENSNYSVEYFINQHTVVPIYIWFITYDKYTNICNTMKGNDGRGIHTYTGIVANKGLKKQTLYYCPICAKEDYERYGEAYYHRNHQQYGVYICIKHNVRLKKVQPGDNSRISLNRLDYTKLDMNVVKSHKHYEALYTLAYMLQFILDNSNVISPQMVNKKYNAILNEKGYKTRGGSIHQKMLRNEFINYYSESFLSLLNLGLEAKDNWLAKLLRNSYQIVDPVKHALVINFLFGNVEKFIDYEEIEIKVYKMHTKKSNNCKKDNDSNKITMLLQYREDILDSIQVNPSLSRTQIREINQKQYTFLYRHDKEWLFNELPHNLIQISTEERVDWNKRDEELVIKIENMAEVLRNRKPLIRITKTRISRELKKQSMIENNIDKLPLSETAFEKVCESAEEFRIRRIDNVIQESRQQEKTLRSWEVQRLAAIGTEYFEHLRDYIAFKLTN